MPSTSIKRRKPVSRATARKVTVRSRARLGAVQTTEKKTSRRGEILNIAARQFARFGFEVATMREIADEAKILSGSIYHHFETKEQMLHEIVREPIAARYDRVVRVAGLELDAEKKLVALMLLSINEFLSDHAAHSILYNERELFRSKREFQYVVKYKQDILQVWRGILEHGVEAGFFKPGIETFLTYLTIGRLLNMSADWFTRENFNKKGERGAYRFDQLIDFSLDFVLSAVRSVKRITAPIPRHDVEDLLARESLVFGIAKR